ncbi:FtsB family cell division protein [Treponema zioleckii]|uniref:FtsB family cell division protein n=1 Tax=Treponema zioleckii TaxID=331680 RepID=UPI001F5B6E09|nr:septum formation initiator family protein [Treponema zioleckii]
MNFGGAADINFIMSKMFRILAASFAGTFIYVLVSLTCGKDGLWADGQLREQKRLLSTRAEEIQKINNSLELEYTALKKDPDVIAAFARKLGYVRDGEKLVKINGLITNDQFYFETGTPLKFVEPQFLPEWFCKTSGFMMFFVVYLYLWLNEFKDNGANAKRKKSRKVRVKGIPVYDLPQK